MSKGHWKNNNSYLEMHVPEDVRTACVEIEPGIWKVRPGLYVKECVNYKKCGEWVKSDRLWEIRKFRFHSRGCHRRKFKESRKLVLWEYKLISLKDWKADKARIKWRKWRIHIFNPNNKMILLRKPSIVLKLRAIKKDKELKEKHKDVAIKKQEQMEEMNWWNNKNLFKDMR